MSDQTADDGLRIIRVLDHEIANLRLIREGIQGLRSIAATSSMSGDLARHGLHWLSEDMIAETAR